jgi:hypothetical protein
VGLKQLWEYLAQYCYFPRLFDREVLLKAVKAGAGRLDAPFAYATGKDKAGCHTGLVFRAVGPVYLDDHSLLVHPEHIKRPEAAPETPPPVPPGPVSGDDGGGSPGGPPEPRPLTRYYGRVAIDPQRANREVSLIVEEVIERLTGQVDSEVEITLEIRASRQAGFDERTVRTISENSRTLKFR